MWVSLPLYSELFSNKLCPCITVSVRSQVPTRFLYAVKLAVIKVLDGGEAVSERKRAFGGKQNLTSTEFPIAKHGSLWLVNYNQGIHLTAIFPNRG